MPKNLMHKIATIVPKAHLDLVRNDDYFMALTHAADDPMYLEFFAERVLDGKYVILDNSAVELGEPEEMETYVSKAVLMGASEIVLPDWFQDADRTLSCVQPGLTVARHLGYKGRYMVVPQGLTHSEWIHNTNEMLTYPIDTIGISCRYTGMFQGSRSIAVGFVEHLIQNSGRSNVNVHLLGCWANPMVDVATILPSRIIAGVDSSYPSVFAKYNLPLAPNTDRPSGGIDVVNDVYDQSLLEANIAIWQQMCGGM